MPDIYDFTVKAIDGGEQPFGDRAGGVAARFAPATAPTASEVRAAIENALGS
jgi:hypothetical protein